jgi:hypothetical protein
MARTVKHFSLHRILAPAPPGARATAGTELRVVSDVEAGVLPVIQVEEEVIRGYVNAGGRETCPDWPHRWVTLFILQDLQPLVHQLGGAAAAVPPSAAAVEGRPVLNVYDLADLDGCHVFVNQRVMAKQGYWGDLRAVEGLLAHEHAHPLAENQATRSSRQLVGNLEIRESGSAPLPELPNSLLTQLAEKISISAAREVFANELAIRGGFGDSLFYLNQLNVANAGRSMAGREELNRRLQQRVTRGTLTPVAADLLLLIGDLESHLDLALEVAPFYRAGRESNAHELESMLETEVFSRLDPQVRWAYIALREQYIALSADLSPSGLMEWGEKVLSILTKVLTEKGLKLQFRWEIRKPGQLPNSSFPTSLIS